MRANAVGISGACVALFLLLCDPAAGQWVSFSDETVSRLVLAPFAEDPTGDPMDDAEEKDMAVGDLDRDGWDDLVVVRKPPFAEAGWLQDILLMNEDGVLVDRTAELAPGFIDLWTDARDVIIGDFDGDEWDDVVIANTYGQEPSFYLNLGNDGGGNWLGLADESSIRFPIIWGYQGFLVARFCAVWGGDVTGNEAPDLFFSNYRMGGGSMDILLINDGNGMFTNETVERLGSYANVAFGTSAEIHDLDNDGDNDIVKQSILYSWPPFDIGQFILFNSGSGVFTDVPFQTMETGTPYMFTVADLNNDQMLDQFLQDENQDRLAIAQSVNPDSDIVYSTTLLTTSPRTAGFGGNTKTVDIDGDGYLDVGVAPIDSHAANCGVSDDFALLHNPGDGMLYDPWLVNDDQNFHLDPHDFGFLDVNNDGCPDIVMGLCTGWRVFIQTCAPPIPGDGDGDGDVDLDDYTGFHDCMAGPETPLDPTPPTTVQDCLDAFDLDGSGGVDVKDFAGFQQVFGTP
ncbi:MAG: FG-GAP repeat domain-containing protein [Planctomycetota bacterium]|jgi:hypothetical protein